MENNSCEPSLQEYANSKFDEVMPVNFNSSRQQNVNLAEAFYVLDSRHRNTGGRQGGSIHCRCDQMRVLNITEEALTIVVLPLSSPDSTVGDVCARLQASDREQIRCALDDVTRLSSTNMVHKIGRRSDFVQDDSTNTTLSEILIMVVKVDRDNTARVLHAQRLLPTADWVLAVLPGILEGGGIHFNFETGMFVESLVNEVISGMDETTLEKPSCPPVKVQIGILEDGGRPKYELLDVMMSDTVETIRQKISGHVQDAEDTYIFHNGTLPPDDCVISEIKVGGHQGLALAKEMIVIPMYLLPGRKKGRLAPPSDFERPPGTSNSGGGIPLVLRVPNKAVTLEHNSFDTVRSLKNRIVNEIVRGRWNDTLPSTIGLKVDGMVLDDWNAPLQLYGIKDASNIELLVEKGVESSVIATMSIPLWPWRSLPLKERNCPGGNKSSFDIQIFSYCGSSKIVFMNRTSSRVTLTCFPTLYKSATISGLTASTPVGVEVGGEANTVVKFCEGFGAPQTISLEATGGFEEVAIPKGMVHEMAVVFGVVKPTGAEYKQLKYVKGGRQVDLLEAFIRQPTAYTHPEGQLDTNDALRKEFLRKLTG